MSAPDVTDLNSWHRTASMASHPSQRLAPILGPGDLLVEIAAGIGAVTVPGELLTPAPVSLSRELVLSTPAYDVWVMSWPAGAVSDLQAHDQFVAFHVVSGSLVEERPLVAGAFRKVRSAGSTTLVPPSTPHSLVSSERTTTVHVHARAANS
jgi:quercetin dioxygenase-like cupin family protein